VDIVSITTPPGLHPDLTMRAARAGKHVCIEKAIALEWSDCLAMQKAVAETGVKTIVSFCLHWNPSLVNTKTSLTGALSAHPTISNLTTGTTSFRPTRSTSGPCATSTAAPLCFPPAATPWTPALVQGERCRRDRGDGPVRPAPGRQPGLGLRPDHRFSVPFADGTVGKVSSILDCEMPYQFNVDIVGTKGTIRGNRVWSTELFPGQTDWAVVPAILPDSGDVTHHPFSGQMDAFVAGILDNAPSSPTSTTPSRPTKSSSPPTAPPPPANPYDCRWKVKETVMPRPLSTIAPDWWDYTTLDPEICARRRR
jgi:hypothetical protein